MTLSPFFYVDHLGCAKQDEFRVAETILQAKEFHLFQYFTVQSMWKKTDLEQIENPQMSYKLSLEAIVHCVLLDVHRLPLQGSTPPLFAFNALYYEFQLDSAWVHRFV